jgi:hypothetical protein
MEICLIYSWKENEKHWVKKQNMIFYEKLRKGVKVKGVKLKLK